MEKERARWTRRQFLQMVGVAGGSAAVYETMVALDLLPVPAAYAGPPQLAAGSGKGKSVVILGAGVAGLCAAHELLKAHYEVKILEAAAANRLGGRNYTVRRGDAIEQKGRADQRCQFDDGLYFNAGPGRIPYHHQALLGYCRDLGIDLEVYVMENRAALFQGAAGKHAMLARNRQVANDTRGYIAELLAKAIKGKALDDTLSADDKVKLLELLLTFGALAEGKEPSYAYKGSQRSGYAIPPGVVHPGEVVKPLPLRQLLDSEFWQKRFYQPEDYLWQATLFHPVRGMDEIVKAFVRSIGSERIIPDAVVTRVRNSGHGREKVLVEYRDRRTGQAKGETADYCISTIPLPLLTPLIGNDTFEPDFKKAVATVPFADTCKVGWQAEKRFWESPQNQIYGGISWINHPITQFWYPSSGYFKERKGVLTGAYNYGKTAKEFGKLDLGARLDRAREGAQLLHPEFSESVKVGLGLSIAWQEVPFLEGGWAEWDWCKKEQRDAYAKLLSPDKRFHVCGDQVSYLSGWQEGSVLSAQRVVRQIGGLVEAVPAGAAELPAAPTRQIVGDEVR